VREAPPLAVLAAPAQTGSLPTMTTTIIEVLGPTIEFLTPLEDEDGAPCVMRGTVPPGAVVPLHSHADPETFVVLSGTSSTCPETPSTPGATRRGSPPWRSS
jgi:quercetin dioxygenase-like cupin family protein